MPIYPETSYDCHSLKVDFLLVSHVTDLAGFKKSFYPKRTSMKIRKEEAKAQSTLSSSLCPLGCPYSDSWVCS